jgi:hypothetical protein
MKSFFLAVCIVGLLMGFSASASAGTFSFSPSDTVLGDLDHNNYYKWAIKNWVLPSEEEIKSATLTYYDIYDWIIETDDHLYTHLLNSVTGSYWSTGWTSMSGYNTKTKVGTDSQNPGDYFSDQGYLFTPVWNDPGGGVNIGFDLSYSIPETYFGWLTDGLFAFGIDPDCHYYNSKVELVIVTGPSGSDIPEVPEPSTILLLGTSLIGLAVWRIRKS